VQETKEEGAADEIQDEKEAEKAGTDTKKPSV
jgi:hypothetical protein